jgi:hypothetical protein
MASTTSTFASPTERSVMQTSEKSKERFAGAIKMPPELQKFFITVIELAAVGEPAKQPQPEDNRGAFFGKHNRYFCFNNDSRSKLDKSWLGANDPEDLDRKYVEEYFGNCIARSMIKIDKGNNIQYYLFQSHVWWRSIV